MTLTTHAVVGAGAASLFLGNPLLAFCAAFLSHFLIDAIPHWDYIPRSMRNNSEDPLKTDMTLGKDFILDLCVIGADALFGILLSLLFFGNSVGLVIAFIGAVGGILPDPLQFVYWKIRKEPLISLQRFHLWIHAKTQIKEAWHIGITFQISLMLFTTTVAKVLGGM
jgi:hypothetical protein